MTEMNYQVRHVKNFRSLQTGKTRALKVCFQDFALPWEDSAIHFPWFLEISKKNFSHKSVCCIQWCKSSTQQEQNQQNQFKK